MRAVDAAALVRLAWRLGNRHLPTELTKRSLRIRRDPVIEEMARGLGATVTAMEPPSIRKAALISAARRRPTAASMTMAMAIIVTTPRRRFTAAIAAAATTTPAADEGGWREAAQLTWPSPAFPVDAFACSQGLEWAAAFIREKGGLGTESR